MTKSVIGLCGLLAAGLALPGRRFIQRKQWWAAVPMFLGSASVADGDLVCLPYEDDVNSPAAAYRLSDRVGLASNCTVRTCPLSKFTEQEKP